jgi:signal transduction histidine kinase
LNLKYREFLLSNLLVTFFTILVTLLIDNILLLYIKDFLLRTFLLSFLGIFFYYFLIKFTLDEFFSGDTRLQKTFKETIHELNTPIATINMNIEMLKRVKLDKKALKRVERIEMASNSILELYEDMEYVLKSEIGSVEKSIFNLKELINDSIDKFRDIKKDITISNQIEEAIFIESDKRGFSKVLSNLISNAIKYNKKNGTIETIFLDKVLIIRDSGIGIVNIHTIFEQYYQENTDNKGFGMGLFIVKKFCDLHKIDIKIESEVGIGTEFRLDLTAILKEY